MSISLNYLGETLLLQYKLDQSRQCYSQSLSIRRKLMALDPTNTAAQIDLATVLAKLGALETQDNQAKQAREYYQEASKLLQALQEKKKLQAVDDIKLYETVAKAGAVP